MKFSESKNCKGNTLSTVTSIGFDLETAPAPGFEDYTDAALDFNRNQVTLYAFSDGVVSADQSVLSQYTGPLVTHNGKFDFKVALSKPGCPLKVEQYQDDTMLMLVALPHKIPEDYLQDYNEARKALNKALGSTVHRDAGKYSLKTAAPYFLGVDRFWEVADHNNTEYAYKDALYTKQLSDVLLRELEAAGTIDFYRDYLMPWSRLLLRMEMRGVAIDMDMLQSAIVEHGEKAQVLEGKLRGLWGEYISRIESRAEREVEEEYRAKALAAVAKLSPSKKKDPVKAAEEDAEKRARTLARYAGLEARAKAGLKQFNFASPKQLSSLLKDEMGLDIRNLDDEESTGKEVLEKLLREDVIGIPEFLEWRKSYKLATAFFPSYQEKQVGSVIHSNFNLNGTRTGRLSSNSPNCLDMQTELLTNRGFIHFDDFNPAIDKVAVWSKSGTVKFELVEGALKKRGAFPSSHYTSNSIDFMATNDHRTVIRNRNNKKISIVTAASLPSDAQWIHGGITEELGGLAMTDRQIRQAIAVQADAYRAGEYYAFGLSKQRKIDRLKELFSGQLVNTTTKKRGSFYAKTAIKVGELEPLLTKEKTISPQAVASMNSKQLSVMIEEVHHWDGLYTRRDKALMYTSKHKVNCDAVQLAMTLLGQRAIIRESIVAGRSYWRVWGTYRDYSMTTNVKKESVYLNEVWCVKVSSSMFIARRNGKPFVTGNCQQVPKSNLSLFIPHKDQLMIYRDASAIEPRLLAYESECYALCKIFLEGSDFHSFNVRTALGIDEDDATIKEKYKAERDLMKEVGLSLLYGASWKRIYASSRKRGMPISEKECKRMFKLFQETYSDVWEYKAELEKQINSGELITNVLGRPLHYEEGRVHMTSLNTKIQSGASDMVLESARIYQTKHPESSVVMLIHDAIVASSPKHLAQKHFDSLGEIMLSWHLPTRWGVIPLKSEGGVKERLGE